MSSETATPTLSTPQATPPQSPLQERAPDISASNELSLHEDVATPATTPPLSQTEEAKEPSLATPQVWAMVMVVMQAFAMLMQALFALCGDDHFLV